MIDLYKPHYEISRTTSEIRLLVFRAGLENAANFLPLLLERIFALGSKMRRIFSLCFSEITLPLPKKNYGNHIANLGPYMAHIWEWYGKEEWWYGADMGPYFGKI